MNVLDIPISEKKSKDILIEFSKKQKGYICVTSIHGIIEAYEHKQIKNSFLESTYNVPDGMPIVLIGKYLKRLKSFSRIYGPSFLTEFLNYIKDSKTNLYIIGSTEKNIKKFEQKLQNNFSNVEVVGKNCEMIDPFNDQQVSSINENIPFEKVDYILVFLSTPKQDLLMNKLYNLPGNKKLIGFGAAIDFFVGDLKSAPKIIQHLSLEWLYRLVQEPRRLYKRYFKIVPKFLFLYFFYIPLIKRGISENNKQTK